MQAFLIALLVAGGLAAKPACFSPDAKIKRRANLSCANKQYAVDIHNKMRNHVASGMIEGQPKAANMNELRWSEDLAKLAQKRTDTCVFDHGDLELNGTRVGQNLAIVTSTADTLRLNITRMVHLWFEEVFLYGYKEGFEPNSGHYSQMIWGNTKEIGCGYTYYEEDGWFKMYFACDYYPPGNYINTKPYDYGKFDCKKYGLLESKKYSKLCVVDAEETSVCKTEKQPLPETITMISVNETDAEYFNETTEELTTELFDDGILTGLEENMEDLTVTEDEGEATESSEHSSLQPPSSGEVTTSEDPTTRRATLEETMARLNETMMTELNELYPDSETSSLVVLIYNGSSQVKLDLNSKRDFFRVVIKMLDLLIEKQNRSRKPLI